MAAPIVTISTGKIQGTILSNTDNLPFFSFQGIPYAKPPIGPLRFKAPVPPEPWEKIRDATTEGHNCYHFHPWLRCTKGSEDCLFLNVYTPKIKKDVGMPVMVWIHGGGFSNGSGSRELYGPEFLLTQDIVLVTMNYRLGIFGFLSLEDPSLDVPGNAGLKDIILALKWVQTNIAQFGGNPKNVTIFGESAGGSAVHYLILSPKAKGLFHKAIMQSGCALNFWARGRRCVQELAQVLSLNTTDERKILKSLQELPVEKLYEASLKLQDDFFPSTNRPYCPVVERDAPDAIITEEPVEIIKSGNYNHVPILIGYNNKESFLSTVTLSLQFRKFATDLEALVPYFLKLEKGSDISRLVAKKIKEFYFEDKPVTRENKDNLFVMDTDNIFVREILRTVIYHKKSSSAPIFLYRLSAESKLNLMKNILGITAPGVCHGDDLGYLFKNVLTPDISSGSQEDILMKRMVKMWTNFAKFGKPETDWKPVGDNELNFMDIGTNLTLGKNPEEERIAFWRKIFQVNTNHKL